VEQDTGGRDEWGQGENWRSNCATTVKDEKRKMLDRVREKRLRARGKDRQLSQKGRSERRGAGQMELVDS